VCSVDAMSVMSVKETDNVEVLELMNTKTTHNVSSDHLDTSLVSTTTVPQTGLVIYFLCIVSHRHLAVVVVLSLFG